MFVCVQVFFVESVCEDPEIIAENIKVSWFNVNNDINLTTWWWDMIKT